MKTRSRVVRRARLQLELQRLTHEIEKLVPELTAALDDGYESRLLAPAARSLQRAAAAVKAIVDAANPGRLPDAIRAVLEGTSPLLSQLGSRVVLSGVGRGALPPTPSIGARALAVLLEEPDRAFGAAEIAARLGCSVPIARTTLHRLVRSGHAARPAPGRFRAAG